MPSKKPVIAVRTDNNTLLKIQKICELENRSMSNYTETLLKNAIKCYEAEHGEIRIEQKSNKE